MSGRKVLYRTVVLSVAVLCVVLLAFTVGFLEHQNRSLLDPTGSDNSMIASLNSRLNSAANSVNSLNATVATLQSQVALQNKTNTSLQTELTTKNVSLNSANSQVTTLQGLLSFSNANQKSMQSEISGYHSTISSLNAQIANLKSTMANWAAPVTDGFSLIQITDTQYLSDTNPALFNTLTDWIASNNDALNISMVIHTGDVVQSAGNVTDWQNANTAMMNLYNNGIPYCWNAGNHDFIGEATPAGNDNSAWIGGAFSAFNVTTMQQEPYWVASIFDGTSTAVQFRYGNYRFMVINVAYDANQTVLDWMQTLLKSNPSDNVIVATHNFGNGVGGYGYAASPPDIDWARNFENIVGNYSNVFMTLSGHDVGDGVAFNQKVGSREEIFFNRQEMDAEEGAASARIYTFNMTNPAHPVVNAYTYQAYSTVQGGPQYLTDQPNEFTFTSNLTAYNSIAPAIVNGTPFVGSSG